MIPYSSVCLCGKIFTFLPFFFYLLVVDLHLRQLLLVSSPFSTSFSPQFLLHFLLLISHFFNSSFQPVFLLLLFRPFLVLFFSSTPPLHFALILLPLLFPLAIKSITRSVGLCVCLLCGNHCNDGVSAAEDEAAEGSVPREDSVHAAGRSRLLLRCSRSDAAFLL